MRIRRPWVAIFAFVVVALGGVLTPLPGHVQATSMVRIGAVSVQQAAQLKKPNSGGCFDDGGFGISPPPPCDGYAPPPITYCGASGASNVVVEQVNIKDHKGAVIGVLQLRYSQQGMHDPDGCKSSWGAVRNTSTRAFTVTGYAVYERGLDTSRGGPYARPTPYAVPAGSWYSTVMLGDGAGYGQGTFSTAIFYTDEYGVVIKPILSTPQWTCCAGL